MQAGESVSSSARMEDKSLSGACLRMKKPIGPGVRLRAQSRSEQFAGVVKYCRSEDWDYIVGVQRGGKSEMPGVTATPEGRAEPKEASAVGQNAGQNDLPAGVQNGLVAQAEEENRIAPEKVTVAMSAERLERAALPGP
jgi:hypothetical protein